MTDEDLIGTVCLCGATLAACLGCGHPYCPDCDDPVGVFHRLRESAPGIGCPDFIAAAIIEQMRLEDPALMRRVIESIKRLAPEANGRDWPFVHREHVEIPEPEPGGALDSWKR